MKTTVVFFILTIAIFFESLSQNLTLNDLISLCNKKKWEDVNMLVLNKGWTFYDSEKGNSEKYNTITWSFNKEDYSDKASGWFYLYTYEEYPNKIQYSVFNKDSYLLIQNSLASAGFKLTKSEIEDNVVMSSYINNSYFLEISFEKREREEYDSGSITAYRITLIKKAGIYDENNGKKMLYHDNGVIKAEFTLKDGKVEGQLKTYYDNGKLEMVGNYSNGMKNGVFKEYDEYGSLNIEYVMSNGTKNGFFKYYDNGKISHSRTYINDSENGQYIGFYYNEETGEPTIKVIGDYLNDEKNGLWKTIYLEDGKERILEFENYLRGIKSGAFQKVQGDSLVVGNYRNGELHGEFKIYFDFAKWLLGGIINTNIDDLELITVGRFANGLKDGYWRYNYSTGSLKEEGEYHKGEKTGEWKNYFGKYVDMDGNSLPHSTKLYYSSNYLDGQLNGKTTYYYDVLEEKFPCSEIDAKNSSLDSCTKNSYLKMQTTAFYEDDELNGRFEQKDSLNNIAISGNFKNGMKNGEWIIRYSEVDENEEPFYYYEKGNYINDKKEGKWIMYSYQDNIIESSNYRNGKLHGEMIEWSSSNKPEKILKFSNDEMNEVIVFDSLGDFAKSRYEIFDKSQDGFKCRLTEYSEDQSYSQEYKILSQDEIHPRFFTLYITLATYKFSDGSKGYKNGEYILKSLNDDKIIISGNYLREEQIGKWTYYFYKQNVKIEINYVNGKASQEKYYYINGDLYSGEFKYTDESKSIVEIRKIKNGLRNGKTVYYDANTSEELRDEKYKNGILK